MCSAERMKVSHYFCFGETDMQTGWICLQNDGMIAVLIRLSTKNMVLF